jgi:hypothetical protein
MGDIEADQKREDDVLRRMLHTKPKPHKDEPRKNRNAARKT